MVRIEATIKPFVAERVRAALGKLGITGLTEVEVHEFGAMEPTHRLYRGAEYVVESVPRAQISVVVPEELESPVIEAIRSASSTGSAADGRILVLPLGKVVPAGQADTARKIS